MNLIENLDSLIRSGSGSQATEIIKKVKPSGVPQEEALELAKIANRLQLSMLAVQLMKKPMKEHREKIFRATGDQIMTYVRPMIRMGFYVESQMWMKEVDFQKFPHAEDMMARIAMGQWDYKKSIFHLKKYRRKIDQNSYQFQISTLNYTASLVVERREEEALPLLKKLIADKSNKENRLLMGNANEILAQAYILSGQYEKANRPLERALKLLGQSSKKYQFYILKWSWIRDLKKTGPTNEIKQAMGLLRNKAVENQFWEDVRDIDRRWAEATSDQELALSLYFGTVHEAYRVRLKNEMGLDTPDYYIRSFSEKEDSVFHPDEYLESGSVGYNLFKILNHDFYRPLSMGHVFSKLYEGEYIDPDSSPARIYRAVQRLNDQLPKGSGLDIQWKDGNIQLQGEPGVGVFVEKKRDLNNRSQTQVDQLRKEMGRKWFNSSQVCEVVGIKKRSAQNLIREARNVYKMESAGRGPSLRYRFCG